MKLDVFKIQLIMAEAEMNLSDVAKKTENNRQNISLVLRRGTCTTKMAGKIAHALGVAVREIVVPE